MIFHLTLFLCINPASQINRRLTTPANLAAQNPFAPHFVKILQAMLFSIITCRSVAFFRCKTGCVFRLKKYRPERLRK